MAYGCRKAGDELGVLAEVFYDDCRHMGENHFVEAIRRHRKKSRFFPTTSEINAEYKDIVANLPAPSDRLLSGPTELSDEQIRINKEGIRRHREKLGRNFEMPGAVKRARPDDRPHPPSDPEHARKVRQQARDIANGNMVIE